MTNRLKPYGRIRPARLTRRHLKAYLLGIRDGWDQPHDLSTSTNVEHLEVSDTSDIPGAQESLDAGINLGQWLRSPLNHQKKED
jgi:hypothetical protein